MKVYYRQKSTDGDHWIHIFYFHHNLAPVILDIIKNLDRNKFRFTICNFWGSEYRKEDFLKYGAQVVCLKARSIYDPSAWWKLVKLLINCSPHIIHTILPELSLPIRLISPFLTKSFTVHTFQNPLSSEPAHLRLPNLFTLQLCDAITGVSTGVVKEITLKRPKLASKIMVTPNGVDQEEFFMSLKSKESSLRDEINLGTEEKLLACVGRLAYQKGQDVLIKAMKILKEKKIQVKLILVGPDYWNGYLQRLVSNLQLGKEIIFLGRRDDIARILANIDIYVAPSRWEGFNIALSEAMLSGVPCIATALPGHSELLINNETAISVAVDNPEELADAIIWVLNYPQEAIRMANNAKKLVEEKYTAKKMAKRYEKLYLSLINNMALCCCKDALQG